MVSRAQAVKDKDGNFIKNLTMQKMKNSMKPVKKEAVFNSLYPKENATTLFSFPPNDA